MGNIPAYMSIRQYVVDLVMDHHDTDIPIMSERELSRKFNVSRTTVRNALADLIADGWVYTKSGLGMFINSKRERNSIHTLRRSYKIVLLMGDGKMAYLDGFYMKMLSVVFEQLCRLPVRLRLANLNGSGDSAVDELKMHNPDGIIWLRPFNSMNDAITALREIAPVYVVGNVADGNVHNVTVDYYRAGRIAAAWFLDQGRKDVIFSGYQPEFNVKSEIFRGWEDEYHDRQLEFNHKLLLSMDDDIVRQAKNLLTGQEQVQGIFSLGSTVGAIDLAYMESGMADRRDDCPVMVDWNGLDLPTIGIEPAVRLIMLPAETAVIAGASLFAELTDPDYVPREVIVEPKIEIINEVKA